jgi:hypothetical protein
MTLGVPKPILRTLVACAAAGAMLVSAAPASAKVEYGFSPQTTLGSSDYQLMNSLKTDLIRHGLSWPGVQPNAGTCTSAGGACNWSFPDSQVGAAASNGLETMLGIYGSAPFVNSDQNKPPVKDVKAWEQFVGAAAQRYGPGGTYWTGPYQAQFGAGAPVIPVKVWQLWNEQSSNQFFEPKPNVKKYAKILVPGSKAIQSADKKATVLLGGMFPDTGPKGIKIEKYLKDLYKQKKVKSGTFDGVAVHPYAKNGKQLDQQIKSVRKTMNKSGGKKDDIWVTEIGYASGGPKKQVVVKKGEKGQAKAITSAYKVLNKKDKKYDIKGIIYFTWQDAPRSTGVCKFCVFAGLLDEQGNQKKAFKAYKKAAK